MLSNRCTTLVHIANGYLYGGQPQQALAVLEDAQPPEKALEMRGLVAGNKATCFLAAGEMDPGADSHGRAAAHCSRQELQKEFVQKARHTLGYLQLCMDIAREGTQMWERFKRILRAAVHRCTGWMCSTVSHWRCATGATRQAWRKAANISLRTVAVPATASLRVHFDTCERYKKARPEASLPRALRSYRKVYFSTHHFLRGLVDMVVSKTFRTLVCRP